MSIYVESALMEDPQLKNNPLFVPLKDQLCYFKEGKDDLTDKIDLIICLGGDGTLLYASSLFQVISNKKKSIVLLMSEKNIQTLKLFEV